MVRILVRSQNEFYKLGLMSVAEKLITPQHHFTCITDKETDKGLATALPPPNLIFLENMAIINVYDKEAKQGAELPYTRVYITFNTSSLLQEEVSGLVGKIIKFSSMDYKQLLRDYHFCKIMSRNNAHLSSKESRILALMGQGHDTEKISRILNCSQGNIYTHRRNLIKKLGIINRLDLYKYVLTLKNFCLQDNIFLSL